MLTNFNIFGRNVAEEICIKLSYYFITHQNIRMISTYLLRWLGWVVVRSSDFSSTGLEFDSQPCTAGLVLRWVTVCVRVNHLSM